MLNPSITIPGKSTKPFQIAFKPVHTVNYWKRIFLLVNHGPPISIDLLGTGHDDENQPAPVTYADVTRWLTDQR